MPDMTMPGMNMPQANTATTGSTAPVYPAWITVIDWIWTVGFALQPRSGCMRLSPNGLRATSTEPVVSTARLPSDDGRGHGDHVCGDALRQCRGRSSAVPGPPDVVCAVNSPVRQRIAALHCPDVTARRAAHFAGCHRRVDSQPLRRVRPELFGATSRPSGKGE